MLVIQEDKDDSGNPGRQRRLRSKARAEMEVRQVKWVAEPRRSPGDNRWSSQEWMTATVFYPAAMWVARLHGHTKSEQQVSRLVRRLSKHEPQDRQEGKNSHAHMKPWQVGPLLSFKNYLWALYQMIYEMDLRNLRSGMLDTPIHSPITLSGTSI